MLLCPPRVCAGALGCSSRDQHQVHTRETEQRLQAPSCSCAASACSMLHECLRNCCSAIPCLLQNRGEEEHTRSFTLTLSPFPALVFSSCGFAAKWSHFHSAEGRGVTPGPAHPVHVHPRAVCGTQSSWTGQLLSVNTQSCLWPPAPAATRDRSSSSVETVSLLLPLARRTPSFCTWRFTVFLEISTILIRLGKSHSVASAAWAASPGTSCSCGGSALRAAARHPPPSRLPLF